MNRNQQLRPTAWRLGRKLAEIRKQQGLTLQELADAVGVHRQRIFDVEHGENNTQVDKLDQMLDALGYELTIQKQKNESDNHQHRDG